jgi:hypothetical protein
MAKALRWQDSMFNAQLIGGAVNSAQLGDPDALVDGVARFLGAAAVAASVPARQPAADSPSTHTLFSSRGVGKPTSNHVRLGLGQPRP